MSNPTITREGQVELLLALSSRLRHGSSDDLESALELATGFLGMEIGIIGRIEGEEYFLEHVHCPEDVALEVGQHFQLERMYCAITLDADEVVAIDEMSSSAHHAHPSFEVFGLESYIGVPLRVDGDVFGTLSFSSPVTRRHPWSNTDRQLMKLLARWVETSISRERLGERLEQAFVSLDQANLELARKNRDLTAFISAASHDLKEPLRNVGILASFLRADAIELGPAGEDNLRLIEQTAARGQTLVEDLLDFARVSRHQNRFEYVGLRELVEGVLSDLSSRVTQTGAVITVGDLPTIWIDRFQVRQLFQNLLANALKYHRTGVPPEIRVEWEPIGSPEASAIELSVIDNGIGFDEAHAERIFQPFKRLHSAESYEGTGIGLSICTRIVERLNGSIRATSQVGVGSTFTVTLPASSSVAKREAG